jgi:hypothetical protein
MDEIATVSHQYYDNHLRGGEGRMEVGKLIQHVEQRRSHMVISVKPFGCMPSSGVSDGVQSLVTARHPDAIFCPIETTGDGAVNVQSRILMDLFKARQRAQSEYRELREACALSQPELERRAKRHGADRPLFYPMHTLAGTASNTLLELEPGLRVFCREMSRSRKPAPAVRHAGFRGGAIPLEPVGSSAKDRARSGDCRVAAGLG